jgi:hypothetical protein
MRAVLLREFGPPGVLVADEVPAPAPGLERAADAHAAIEARATVGKTLLEVRPPVR